MLLKKSKQTLSTLLLWSALTISSAPLMAETSAENNASTRTSKSISFAQSVALDDATKDAQFKQANADVIEVTNTQGYRVESPSKALYVTSVNYVEQIDITIYDTSVELISDFNNDGFYHRFNVTIDADTVYESSYIYAKVFLSYEGGPWVHYATSDNYLIYGDSELDTFVIETELADGFSPGYYDIRIELYDADFDHWLFSYGPYDDVSLSALPLEDSYFDDIQEVIIVPVESEIIIAASHGGSIGWLFLLLPFMVTLLRMRNTNNPSTT